MIHKIETNKIIHKNVSQKMTQKMRLTKMININVSQKSQNDKKKNVLQN